MRRDLLGHCDHHTERDPPESRRKPRFFALMADRYARFRRAMADFAAFLREVGPPILPPLGPGVALAAVAARKAASEAEEAFAGWQVTTRDGSESRPWSFLPVSHLAAQYRQRLAYNPRKGWYRIAWPGLRYGPYPSADHALSGFGSHLFNLRSTPWTTD